MKAFQYLGIGSFVIFLLLCIFGLLHIYSMPEGNPNREFVATVNACFNSIQDEYKRTNSAPASNKLGRLCTNLLQDGKIKYSTLNEGKDFSVGFKSDNVQKGYEQYYYSGAYIKMSDNSKDSMSEVYAELFQGK